MNLLNNWLQGIIIAVVISTIIEMILPNGNSKKYIKVILGLYVLFNIVTPIINIITKKEINLSSIINSNDFAKATQSYEVSSINKNISQINENSIKEIYKNKLKNDIKAKIEEKEYEVEKIIVEVEDNEEYKLKQISLFIKNINTKEAKSNIEENENILLINTIKVDEIKIDNNKEDEALDSKSNLSKTQKEEIKKYLSSIYEIKESQILVN